MDIQKCIYSMCIGAKKCFRLCKEVCMYRQQKLQCAMCTEIAANLSVSVRVQCVDVS